MYKKKKDPSAEKKSTKKKEASEPVEPQAKKEEDMKEVEESLFSDVELPKRRNETPEEEEIGLIEAERPKKQEKRPFTISESASRPEMRQIVIRFNPRIMERAAYIGAIVILLLLVIYFATTSGSSPLDEEAASPTDNTPSEEKEPATTPSNPYLRDEQQATPEEENEEETMAEESKPADGERDQSDEELTPEQIENEVPLNGNVSITITGVQTETTPYGGKVKSVSFIVDNGDEPFVPKIKIYVYDEDTKTDRLLMPTTKVFDTLGSGKRLIADVKISGASFSEDQVETEKTVLIKLFDEGEKTGFANDRLLEKAETTTLIK